MKVQSINEKVTNVLKYKSFHFVKSNLPAFTYSYKYNEFIYHIKHELNGYHEYYIFLLGIKNFNTHHLNVVVYNKPKNIVYRFDPNGIDESSNNLILKNKLIDAIVKIFNLDKSPTFKYNNNICKDFNGTNCALVCIQYIKKLRKFELHFWGLKYY